MAVTNPSFEGSTGWTGLTTGSEEFWAAPFHLAGAPATTQTTEIAGRPNQRHVYATYKSVPAELQLLSGSVVVATSGKVVSAPQLKGVAQQDDEKAPNDDGGNGWFDGDYRSNLVSASFTKPTARIRSQTLGSTAFDGMAKGPIKLEGLQSGAPLMYSDYYHAW